MSLWSESTPDGGGSTFTYDTTQYSYNDYGEVVQVQDPDGNLTESSYDTAGRLYKSIASLWLGRSQSRYDRHTGRGRRRTQSQIRTTR